MPADTLTLTLLDREVVLTRRDEDSEIWVSDDDALRAERFPCGGDSWRLGLSEGYLVGFELGQTLDEAAAACDQKLRQLREWLNG